MKFSLYMWVVLFGMVGEGSAFAQTVYTGQPIKISLVNALRQLNTIGPVNSTGPAEQQEVWQNGADRSYITKSSFTEAGGQAQLYGDDYTPDVRLERTDIFNWSDVDLSTVGVSQDGSVYTVTFQAKGSSNGFTSEDTAYFDPNGGSQNPASSQQVGAEYIHVSNDINQAKHYADLIETVLILAGTNHSQNIPGHSNGATLSETVEQNPLSDGTSIVRIKNITSKSIYLTASTQDCSNLEVTQCGPQLNHVRVAPKSTVSFWIDRDDDSQSWSFSVSCIVNGSAVSDCSTGGGGGPKSSSASDVQQPSAPSQDQSSGGTGSGQ